MALTLPRQNSLPLRLSAALDWLHRRWQDGAYLVRNSLSVADIAAAALLSALALIPQYRLGHPWLVERIAQIHGLCGETQPPGFESLSIGRCPCLKIPVQ
ncbi:hypothetical protein NDI47_04090 [Microcoleus vaginatus GB1-A2]|uniref:hypothetical protein n=1 Tax=Microcoleus vaginatus TaxID=119532 RepID=UPI0032A5D639